MLGTFGFSYVGLIYLLMLFIPNIIWSKFQPHGYKNIVGKEHKVLIIFERVGQVCVTCTVIIFNDYNLNPFTLWSLWFIASFVLMLLYELAWVRYFTSKHTLNAMYEPFFGIPVPLALLPVCAFLLLGIYGKVIWLILAAIILGIGHVGIHLQHYHIIKKQK